MSSGTGPILISLCTTIGFDLSFSRKSWHFCTSAAVSGSTGYFATGVEIRVGVEEVVAEAGVEVEVEVEVRAEVDERSSEGGGTFFGGRWDRWMDGMTCIGVEYVMTLATAVRSISRSSSGGISSNLRITSTAISS
jgi:hypothetical protein